MKIAIVGTGGVGGYYGGLLAQTGHDVTFIARGEHLQAIRSSGLQVKSKFGDFDKAPTLPISRRSGAVTRAVLHKTTA
jgi:2-dehydropantoate 2-reductase